MKKYNVIYADPPWQQYAGRPISGGHKVVNGKKVFNPTDTKSAPLPYNTMSIEDIKNLNVSDIADDNCHLYLWVTNRYLMEAKDIIEAWGFKYSTTLVWSKKQVGGGLGGVFKVSTEFLIFATKGKVYDITKERTNVTCFDVKRQYEDGKPCHSKKPYFFYRLIEKTSIGRKIELFSRKKRRGWHAWGNELEKSDIQLKVKSNED